MKNIIKMVEKLGYSIIEDEYNNAAFAKMKMLWVVSPAGKKTMVQLSDDLIVFADNNFKISSADEAKKLASEGKILAATGNEIYRVFHSEMKDADFKYASVPYSERAKDALDAEKEKLGYIDFEAGRDIDEVFSGKVEIVPGFLDTTDIEIGRTKYGTWCAQFGYRVAIDDDCTEKMLFSRKPTEEVVKKAIQLRKIELDLSFNRINEYFTCCECGREVFWLDLAGDIYECARLEEEKFCGCCD